MKKNILVSLPVILLVLLIFFLVGLDGFSHVKSRCKRISGVVTAIYEDGTKDAVLKLEGHSTVFYINRGFENGFHLPELSEKLKGKEVNILYADGYTALGSIAECRPITELSTNEEMVYSEFENN